MKLLAPLCLAGSLMALAHTQDTQDTTKPQSSSGGWAPSKPLRAQDFGWMVGTWRGKGVFGGSGEAVSSTMTIAMPNSKTVEIHEKEDAPKTYQYIGLWSLEKVTDRLMMLMSSSLDGPAVYRSPGWQNDRLVFEPDAAVTRGASSVRWTYVRLPGDRLEVTYEYSVKDVWHLGDRQTFDKINHERP